MSYQHAKQVGWLYQLTSFDVETRPFVTG